MGGRDRARGTPLLAWGFAGLAALGGAALQMQQPMLWSPWPYAALVIAALVAGGFGRRHTWVVALALATIAFAATGLRAHARLAERLDPALEGRDIAVTGVVAELPRALPDGVRFLFEVERATDGDQRELVLPPLISLGWYRGFADEPQLLEPYAALRAGQRWKFTVRLKRPHGMLNPHGFDYELWAFEQGIGATGTVRATARAPAQLLHASTGHPVERLRQHLRDAIGARVADGRTAGVLAALVVGDQAAIERIDWELFRATGIAHLVSISGLHVTMFAWLAAAAIAALWRRSPRAMHWLPAPLAGRWGGVAAAALYALVAGWGVPAQRTVWMLATTVALTSLGARWPMPLVLIAAAVVVTAIDPWALLQPGFWLSFVAVGLLFATAPPQPVAADVSPKAKLAQALRGALRTQAAATLGLAPLSMVFFAQVSLVGFVANLVAIPLVTLVITPLALLGTLAPPLWHVAAWFTQGLTQALAALGTLPGAVWNAAVAPPWAQAAGLLAGLLVVMPLPWALRALALPLGIALFVPPIARPAEGAMQLIVADVGQGSAIVVRTRSHTLLHDAGAQYSRDADAGTRVLVPLLRHLGWAPVDLLMLSHRDSDHVGGAAALLAAQAVRELSSSLEAEHPLRASALPHGRCEAGQSWQWDGVRFEVLHPGAEDHARAAEVKPNAMSCVLRVTDAAGRRVLLTGDIEAEQEARLVAAHGSGLRAEVLVVPHHGSATSSTEAFLAAVSPRRAIVQAGYRNRFGHPAPVVLARYAERGVVVQRSDTCGAWTTLFAAEGGCERERARRYWHHPLP